MFWRIGCGTSYSIHQADVVKRQRKTEHQLFHYSDFMARIMRDFRMVNAT